VGVKKKLIMGIWEHARHVVHGENHVVFFGDGNLLDVKYIICSFFVRSKPTSNYAILCPLNKGNVVCNLGVNSLLHPIPGPYSLFILKRVKIVVP
jgi:uncharacterized protein YgiM (DUF1202 family)